MNLIKFSIYIFLGFLIGILNSSGVGNFSTWVISFLIIIFFFVPYKFRNKEETKADKLDLILRLVGYTLGYFLRFLFQDFFGNG